MKLRMLSLVLINSWFSVHVVYAEDYLLDGELPLGYSGLTEEQTTAMVEPGLTHTKILRGELAPQTFWTVEVGYAVTLEEADTLLDQLQQAGFEGRLDPTTAPRPDGGPLGFMVRVGAFDSSDEAQTEADRIIATGLVERTRVQHTAEDGGAATGPWVVNILEIDPHAYRGDVRLALSGDITPGRERPSEMAARLDGFAAVNGGFFVFNDDLGIDGEPAGLAMVNGRLASEGIDGRPALVFSTGDNQLSAHIQRHVVTLITLALNGETKRIDGINREPGFILNCGNPGDTPITTPAHDFLCNDDDELILFTRDFGEDADAGEGFQVMLSETGEVLSRQESRGGPIPAQGYVLQGTGDEAQWLATHARMGQTLTIDIDVVARMPGSLDNTVDIKLKEGVYAVNGGPTLIDDGETVLAYPAEGWSPATIADSDRHAFYNAWLVRRNPRTAAGIREDGSLVLVVVDGRNPEHSIGASIPEMAGLMRHLGAIDAINLDGGGSSAMVVNGELVGIPSDMTDERAVSDAIVFTPADR